jgi:glycosyltransferase involved in cell wall biosynthesis
MTKDLPRILFISEANLSKEGKGINRTMVNLLEDYPPELLMVYSPATSFQSEPTAPPFDRQVSSFPGYYLPLLRNRIGKFINPLINAVNLQILDLLPIDNVQDLEKFAPEIILICPNTSWCLLMGYKLTQYFQCPSLIYFMDDWIATDNSRWLSSSVQKIADKLLKDSAGWLMISESLQAELSSRYQLKPQRSLIVHNPVDLSDKKPPKLVTTREGTFKVIYAGSIWPMHYDALAAIAEAIFQLKCEGKDIELVLHTDECFWNQYKAKWQLWEVTYGSLISYHELDKYLKRADLLLVASSFLPKYAHMTRSSVQTKLTDYMAAGRAILACGPSYSACNQFLKKWNCGLVYESDQVSEIKPLLLETMNNWYLNQKIATVAFEILKDNFEKSKVNSSLYEFFQLFSKPKYLEKTFEKVIK